MARRKNRTATRADLIRLVNLFRLRTNPGQPKLFSVRNWQQAAFIARQRKLLPEDVIRDLTKHGVAIR